MCLKKMFEFQEDDQILENTFAIHELNIVFYIQTNLTYLFGNQYLFERRRDR